MDRKLIQLSPSTCVISLPSKWLAKHKLKKGDIIKVTPLGDSLVVGKGVVVRSTRIDLDLRSLSDDLFYAHVDGAYIAGYDEICFMVSPAQQKKFSWIANEVPGMMIIEQSSTRIVLKDITGNNREDVTTILRRIFHLLVSMIEDAITDKEAAKNIKEKDYVLNSYISYCQRQINKHGYDVFEKTGLFVAYLKLLEIFVDVLCVEFPDATPSTKKATLKVVRDLQKIHLKYSSNLLRELYNSKKKLSSRLSDVLFDLLELEVQLNL